LARFRLGRLTRTMFESFKKRRETERTLAGYLSPEAVATVIDGSLDPRLITPGHIEFVLVFVRADTPAQVGERMGRVADIGLEHGAIAHDLVSSLVVLAHGTYPAPSEQPFSRAALVHALQHRFGSDIKIVHGAASGHYGNFGNATRLSFTFSVPRFDAALATLGGLAFGHTEEFRP